jgi:hypothetical protein
VIRSLNADKPYARFIEEQIAGDVLFPSTADGIERQTVVLAVERNTKSMEPFGRDANDF